MKIALMTNNYKPIMGGVPISIERLYRGLTEAGHEVTIFAPTYENQPVDEPGVFRYKTLVKHFTGGIVLPNSLDPAIDREFRNNRYDVIHVHHPIMIGNTAVMLSKKYNIPLVFTYHTRYEQYLSYAKGIKRLETDSLKQGFRGTVSSRIMRNINERIVPNYINSFSDHCDVVFAPTPGMKDYLEDKCRVDCDKVKVLPTGLENDEFEADTKRVNEIRKQYISNGDFLFACVCRISLEKNIEFMLNTVARLKEKTDMPFKLLMIGDGPKREEYIEECRRRGLDEVVFVGKVENHEIKNYCRAADAFLFTSKSETQGIVIIEALAVGTPVLALRASGVDDVIMNGVNGMLCSEDVEEFSNNIYSYMRGAVDNDLLSANAVFTALEFSEERIAAKAVNAYRYAISQRNMNEERGTKHYGRKIPYLAG